MKTKIHIARKNGVWIVFSARRSALISVGFPRWRDAVEFAANMKDHGTQYRGAA